jgi:CBS domain-containing protein
MSRVKDVLAYRELYSVEPHLTVAEVAHRMAELHVGAILVMDGGTLKGIFSERDFLVRVVVGGRDPNATAVSEVMTTNVITIDAAVGMEEAMETMRVHNCRHLPVTDDGRVVAFLSMRDLMNFALEQKTEELHHMRAYIHGSAG